MTYDEILKKLKNNYSFKSKNKNDEYYKPYNINTNIRTLHCNRYKKTLKSISRIGKFSSYDLDGFIKSFEERFEFIY